MTCKLPAASTRRGLGSGQHGQYLDLLDPSAPKTPGDQHRRLDVACQHLDAPVAVLDVHALSANAHSLVQRARGKPVRIASKSIRSTGVLKACSGLPATLAS